MLPEFRYFRKISEAKLASLPDFYLFGIFDIVSCEHNCMQAIDKFDIGSYNNEELTSK